MKALKGHLSVGRISGSDIADPIKIEITDKASGSIIAKLHMSLESFATAITGCGYQDCSIELNDDPRKILGKHIKAKTEMIPFKWDGAYNDAKGKTAAAAKAAKPYLVDGWCDYRESDFFNHHNWSRNKQEQSCQSVTFWRYDAQLTESAGG